MGEWHWKFKKIILGGLILLNAFVWPMWLGIDGWIKFFAALMVIFGLVHLIFPKCYKPPKKKKR